MTPVGRGQPRAVARVLQGLVSTARRHDMLPAGESVVVACSGGPDSMCLLHALHRLRRLFRIRVSVFHFDHRLRPGSDRDAAYVARQARQLGLPYRGVEASGRPPVGASVEAWARLARYAALSQAAGELGAGRVALGHTVDDQAETVLLGLARGGGLDAVAGMPAVTSIPPLGVVGVRPLIEITGAETRAFCRALRLRPRSDPTNRDPRFLRNRIRLEVLPALEAALGRNLRATLARTADLVRGDADYLEALASEAAARITGVGEEEVRLDAAGLSALPRPIGARVARAALRVAAAMGGEWESEAASPHVLGVLDLASGGGGRRLDLPGDLVAERVKGYVRISSPGRARRKGEP
ncbi:MAG TPA: tRNA lysidine(34) synthetase TilS [Actinomycetota bacterium]|nr:tRNA lysidine(34) synthetase TilS [Actinomycetota bacterium]